MVQHGKPHPGALFCLLPARWGFDPADCVVVEDGVLGVEAGRAAGMRVLGYASARRPGPAFENWSKTLTSMAQLPATEMRTIAANQRGVIVAASVRPRCAARSAAASVSRRRTLRRRVDCDFASSLRIALAAQAVSSLARGRGFCFSSKAASGRQWTHRVRGSLRGAQVHRRASSPCAESTRRASCRTAPTDHMPSSAGAAASDASSSTRL